MKGFHIPAVCLVVLVNIHYLFELTGALYMYYFKELMIQRIICFINSLSQ